MTFGELVQAHFGAPPVLDPLRFNQPGRGTLLSSGDINPFGGEQASPSSLLAAMAPSGGPDMLGAATQPAPIDTSITPMTWAVIIGAATLVLLSGHFLDDRRLITKPGPTP